MASEKVVIIGAGASGYSAGVDLMKHGFDVTILEAESRIGGRVNSIEIDPGKYIDLGAQWVHGQKGNTIYEFIGENFKYGSTRYDSVEMNWLFSNGKNSKLNETEINALWEMGWSIVFNEHGELSKFEGNFDEYIDKFYNEQLKDEKYAHISPETSEKVKDLLKDAAMGLYAANSCSEIGSKLLAKYTGEATGDHYLTWRTEGYKTVFDFISEKRPDSSKHIDIESKIQLNKKVTNIKWNPEGKNEKIKIVCADGSKYEADHVVFTASAGVLKARHTELFTPNLPVDKVKAIEDVGFGPLGKLFLEFDNPFWPIKDDFIGYYFLWDSNDMKEIQATDKSWILGTLGFYIVDAYPNLIEFFFVGKSNEQLESLPLDKIESDILWLLQKFMNLNPPKPKRIFRTSWQSNENFLGAYSFISSKAGEDYSPATLARPLKDVSGLPKILFAGEATSSDFSGYVNGAASTGWRAAKELIEAIGKH